LSKVLFLSNGHGEDLSGSLLAKKLVNLGHKVYALPIVGNGKHYKKEGVQIIGKTKEFNTAGLGYNTLKGRLTDLVNGQVTYFFRKFLLTLLNRNKYDYYFVVGDIVPILFVWLIRKEYFLYLVAYSSHYEGKLSLPWPCKLFLKSNKLKKIYSRDYLTAVDLAKQLKKEVKFFGNPFMDKLLINKSKNKSKIFHISFLPGSRIPEMNNNLELMLALLEFLSNYDYFQNMSFNFALVTQFSADNLKLALLKRKWQFKTIRTNENFCNAKFKLINVNFQWNTFDDILQKSDLIISMAGTATEQAIGLGKPVIQMEGKGPQFTKRFAEAQRRLLGDYVFCATNYSNKSDQLKETYNLLLRIIYMMKLDKNFLVNCKRNALLRIGEYGAGDSIINDLKNLINE
tara:strand:- start:2337 stop:3536 length:1200 start_codon:yes stop_codon:yes gene_type:complete